MNWQSSERGIELKILVQYFRGRFAVYQPLHSLIALAASGVHHTVEIDYICVLRMVYRS
jgi:hypothetical protein